MSKFKVGDLVIHDMEQATITRMEGQRVTGLSTRGFLVSGHDIRVSVATPENLSLAQKFSAIYDSLRRLHGLDYPRINQTLSKWCHDGCDGLAPRDEMLTNAQAGLEEIEKLFDTKSEAFGFRVLHGE